MRSCIEQDESIVSLQVLYIAEFVPGVQAVGESVQHEESRPGTFGLIVETHTSIGHIRHERRPPRFVRVLRFPAGSVWHRLLPSKAPCRICYCLTHSARCCPRLGQRLTKPAILIATFGLRGGTDRTKFSTPAGTQLGHAGRRPSERRLPLDPLGHLCRHTWWNC